VDDPWANRIRTRHVTTETPSTTTDKYRLSRNRKLYIIRGLEYYYSGGNSYRIYYTR
jgi:hypothetical protein